MKIGPRYLSKSISFPDVEAERAALLGALRIAPGIVSIENVEPHLKGGHTASLVIDRGSLDDFIVHMDSQGWLGCL